MKSAFGSKRKPRKIEVDEDEGLAADPPRSIETIKPYQSGTPSNAGHKAFKKSSLHKSIILNDDQTKDNGQAGHTTLRTTADEAAISDGHIQPSIGRSISTSKKKKVASSRLSFGPGEIISSDAAEAPEDSELFTQKISLRRRVIESDTLRKTIPAYRIPIRGSEDEDERPIYSKDYLNELKSSTPNTPKDLRALSVTADSEEGLNGSELDGAIIVDTEPNLPSTSGIAAIPTEAEIREKKERRIRLAQEQNFIPLNDDSASDRQQLSFIPRRNKTEKRLVREDEDFGEGFDEFVDDGRVSLGNKAEQEAKLRQRVAMANMIHEAELSSSDMSDDSEAERLAAFETAQTRAGMDGLSKPDATIATHQIPPKITPLPNLSDCLQHLQTTLTQKQQELAHRYARMAELQQEKQEILTREEEVQRLLKEAGDRYAIMRADTSLPAVDTKALVEGQSSFIDPMIANRGLESFGNTPTGHPQINDVG